MNLRGGGELPIYMNQILMAASIITPYMVCGYGPMLGVCGIGRTCYKKQEYILEMLHMNQICGIPTFGCLGEKYYSSMKVILQKASTGFHHTIALKD